MHSPIDSGRAFKLKEPINLSFISFWHSPIENGISERFVLSKSKDCKLQHFPICCGNSFIAENPNSSSWRFLQLQNSKGRYAIEVLAKSRNFRFEHWAISYGSFFKEELNNFSFSSD